MEIELADFYILDRVSYLPRSGTTNVYKQIEYIAFRIMYSLKQY